MCNVINNCVFFFIKIVILKFHITSKSPQKLRNTSIPKSFIFLSCHTRLPASWLLFLYLSSSPAKLLKVSRTVPSGWIVLHLCSAWKIPIYALSVQLLSVPLRRLSWPSLGDVSFSCLSALISPLKLVITCFLIQLPH